MIDKNPLQENSNKLPLAGLFLSLPFYHWARSFCAFSPFLNHMRKYCIFIFHGYIILSLRNNIIFHRDIFLSLRDIFIFHRDISPVLLEIKINQGTVELDGENVEEKERSKDADAEIRRLISLRERTEAVARHAEGETHHHDRKTNVRKETLRKTTAPDATHHVQQYSMGNHRETNHHEDEQQKLEKHHSHGYPLAIFPAVEMKQTAPVECPQRDAEQQEPDQHRLHQILRKASEEPSDALGIEQRAREGFRHRSRLQPRYQHQDALANQQSASQPCPQTGQLPINRFSIPHSPIPHDLSPL